jgi:hypothetical protein
MLILMYPILAQTINPAQRRIAERSARSPEKVFKTVALAWQIKQ